jgi:hypothetical protein
MTEPLIWDEVACRKAGIILKNLALGGVAPNYDEMAKNDLVWSADRIKVFVKYIDAMMRPPIDTGKCFSFNFKDTGECQPVRTTEGVKNYFLGEWISSYECWKDVLK